MDQWTALEIRKGKKIWASLNALEDVKSTQVDLFKFTEWPEGGYDIALTNPPFSLAWEMLHFLWPHVADICFLLRLNFLGSAKRHPWLQQHQPNVYVLPNRPSFSKNKEGKRGTDSIEYGWFHFDTRTPCAQGRIELLDLTPKSERVG